MTLIRIVVFLLFFLPSAFSLYVSFLNYRHSNSPLPSELKDVYDPPKYDRWKQYFLEGFRLNIIQSVLSMILILVLLFSGAFAVMVGWSEDITPITQWQNVIFLMMYLFLSFVFESIFKYFSVFQIEEKYGFNKTTKKLFFIDRIKIMILAGAAISGLIYGLASAWNHFGIWFYLFAFCFAILFIVITNLIYVPVIVPLFNKLTPLATDSLKAKIEDLSTRTGYRLSSISVLNQSLRSTKLNAYFAGLGKAKRIVLFDTLIHAMSEEEITAVLAHEIGHDKKRHIWKMMAQSVILIAGYLLILYGIMHYLDLHSAFGVDHIAFGFSILLFLIVMSPLEILISILANVFSRKHEYEADAFAASQVPVSDMVSALKRLSLENFSNLTPHPLYVLLHYTHPPLKSRIEALNRHS